MRSAIADERLPGKLRKSLRPVVPALEKADRKLAKRRARAAEEAARERAKAAKAARRRAEAAAAAQTAEAPAAAAPTPSRPKAEAAAQGPGTTPRTSVAGERARKRARR